MALWQTDGRMDTQVTDKVVQARAEVAENGAHQPPPPKRLDGARGDRTCEIHFSSWYLGTDSGALSFPQNCHFKAGTVKCTFEELGGVILIA